jgi:ABC-2 type transport system ATP-binding protein
MQVEVTGLTRRFGSVTALDDVGFALPPGRRVALVGPNGSGKSTLNRVLAGLLAYEGSVLLDGRSPRERVPEISAQVAYLPQVAPQLGAPVRELVRAVTTLRRVSVDAVAARAETMGLDLDALATRPLRGLSGGMRQKLMLALTLASPVSLLVLDEPTGSLDPATRRRFFDAFGELVGDATVVLCSHRLEEVRALVDHVIVLEEGRVVHDGSASAFLSACAEHAIEVRVDAGASGRWLESLGFREGAQGWWTRTASGDEKRALVRRVVGELGDALLDLEVRAIEELDFSAAGAAERAEGAAAIIDLASKRRA